MKGSTSWIVSAVGLVASLVGTLAFVQAGNPVMTVVMIVCAVVCFKGVQEF